MQSNKKNTKTTCTENTKPIVPLPAEKVAEIAGCSEVMVKMINTGKRKASGKKGRNVALVQDLWAFGSNNLIKEIERIVPLPDTSDDDKNL